MSSYDTKAIKACMLIELAKFSQRFKNRSRDEVASLKNFLSTVPVKKMRNFDAKTNTSKPSTKNASKYPYLNKIMLKKEGDKKVFAYVPLGGEYTSHFGFANPIIDTLADGSVVKHYDTIKEGDTLFVWQCLNKTGKPFHICAVIKTQDDKYYSFGFGLKSSTLQLNLKVGIKAVDEALINQIGQAEGILYSPDGMFETQMLRQCTNKSGKYVDLITSVNLTAEHVQSLKSAFNELSLPGDIEGQDIVFMGLPDSNLREKYADELRTEIVEKLGFSAEMKENIAQYSELIKQDKTVPCEYIYSRTYSLTHNYIYCKFSARHSSTRNCASFIDRIFKGSLNCGLLAEFIAVDPSRCKTGSLPIKSCRKTLKLKSKSKSKSKSATTSRKSKVSSQKQ